MDGDQEYGHWLALAMIWALALAGLGLATAMLADFGHAPGRLFIS